MKARPFRVVRRHRGQGIELFLDRRIMWQIAGQLRNLKGVPALDALGRLLVQELKRLQEDDTWSMEGAPKP